MSALPKENLRTVVALIEDRPGVLARMTSLIRRRSYNIDSLTVGRTEIPGVSRMTLVMASDPTTANLVVANLYKQVNVLRVEDVTQEPHLVRDLAMIKVGVSAEKRPEVIQLAEVFRARVVDMGPESVIFELTGAEDKLSGLVDVLRPYGILEMVRTGAIAMSRGPKCLPIEASYLANCPPSEISAELSATKKQDQK